MIEQNDKIERIHSRMISYDNYSDFFNSNFEFIQIKKKNLPKWVGFEMKKVHPELFNLQVQNLIKMYYLDFTALTKPSDQP